MISRIYGLSVRRLGMFAASCLLPVALRTAFAEVAVPLTPAGSTLAAWMEAFNSGDRVRLEEYYKTHDPSAKVDDVTGFRERTGGFDLISIQRNEPLHIEFLVKERDGETEALGELEVADTDSPRVTKWVVRATNWRFRHVVAIHD